MNRLKRVWVIINTALVALTCIIVPLASVARAGADTASVGTNTILSSTTALPAGYKGATQYPVSQSGTIFSLTMYLDGKNGSSGSQSLIGGVYADSNGAPGTLLGSSAAQTVTAKQSAAWVTFTLATPFDVTAGQKIWLTAFSPSGSNVVRVYSDATAGYTSGWSTNSGSALSSSYGQNNTFTGRTDIYATETLAAATTPPPPPPPPSSPPTSAMAVWNNAVANRANAPAKWVAIGDSVTEGQGASSRANRWIDLTTAKLRGAYPVTGVTGGANYIPAVYRVYSPDSTWSHPWSSSSGTVSPYYSIPDLGYRALKMNSSSSVTYPVTGDTADIWYVASSGLGTMSYKVDNGPAVTVDTNSATYQPNAEIKNVSLGSSGPHTITISAARATVGLDGFTVYNGDRSSGIQLYDSAYTSGMVSTFLQDLSNFHQALAQVSPQLVTVALGGNEYLNQVSPTTYGANLKQLISSIESLPNPPSIELIAWYQPAVSSTLKYSYQDYMQQMQNMVAADPAHLSFLNLNPVMPVATKSGTGYYSTDGLHPNDNGEQFIANLVYQAIAPTGSSN